MKDTTKIVEELGLCSDFKTFYDENKDYMIKEDLSSLLDTLIKKYNLKKSQVIRCAEISEVYAYQIFSGKRVPERKKLLCLALAMELSLDEVQSLLKCAGYSTLYVKLPFDSVIIYGICKKLSVIETNEILYNYNLETLR
ncbi:MAG: XRE family transcriptional regulator [Clostridia bacterium]|nr:XRE family transcriptional regulator [Clostridia bacterium]